MIKQRDFVIVNEVDRPCAGLVAVVTAVNEDSVECEYISADLSHNGSMAFPKDVPAKVEDFGMMVLAQQFQYIVGEHPTNESVARYKDGKLRLWQEEYGGAVQPLKEKFWKEFCKVPEVPFIPEDGFVYLDERED